MPRISAIIVTRNNRRDIGRSVASLAASRQPVDEVIVIDQGSTDGTADFIRRQSPDVCLLDFPDNPGFGEGNNRGARVASADYLMLLNPDATVEPDCIGQLTAALEREPGAGIAVPKIVLAGEPAILNSAGLCVNAVGYGWDRGYLEWDAGQFDRAEPILAGSGCALLIRADVFRDLGGFDAPYFLYYEDVDLCWRSWIIGAAVRYVPQAVVRHAMKVSGRPDFYNEYLDHRNRLRTLLKNASGRMLARIGPDVLKFEIRSALDRARRQKWSHLGFRTRAWAWNVRLMRDTIERRRAVQGRRMIADEELAPLFAPGNSWPRLRAALPGYRETGDHEVDRSELHEDLIMGTNDAGALGLGWYGLEPYGSVPSRWCCGYGIAFLATPEGRSSATLRITCSVAQATEAVVRTNGQERGRFALEPGAHQTIETLAPLVADVTRVEILVSSPFVPAQLDPASPDDRTLGIAVSRLALL